MSAARRSFKLPEPIDVWRDEVDAFIGRMGHDPAKVLRVRIHGRSIEVDLVPPRRDVTKLTVTHPIMEPNGGDEE